MRQDREGPGTAGTAGSESPSSFLVSEILLILNNDFAKFDYFFLLLNLLNNGHDTKLKWVTAGKGGGGGGGATTKGKLTFYCANL